MKSSWLLLIVFLVAQALLILFCARWHAPRIQASLTEASVQALGSAGVDLGSGLVLDGRDAWLTGQVATVELKSQAEAAVKRIRGVRVVHNLLTVGAPAPAPASAPAPAPAVSEVQRSIDELIAGRIVEFESGSATLTAGGQALVDEVADLLELFPDARVEIGGHTDSQGSAGNNRQLSARRAETVRRRLIENGVAAASLTAEGYGESRPLADNNSPEGRLRNRRVEFNVQ